MCADVNRIKAGAAFIELSLDRKKLSRGLVAAQQQLRSFGQALQGVGSDLLAFGISAGIPFYKSIRTFSDFTDKIKTLRAISSSSDDMIKVLHREIRDLGASTAFTASQVADCAIELSRMGFSGSEIISALKPMLNLVRATGEPVRTLGLNTMFTASALKIFNLPASKTSDVCDVMAYAANSSSTALEDMGEALKIVGPSAFAVGEDLRDVAASLMVLANAGIRGSLAGTSLRKVYQSLAAQSDEGKKGAAHLRNLGIEVKNLKTGNLRKMADILLDLSEVFRKMKSGEKINFATDVFDLRGSLGALAQLNKTFDLSKFRKELNSVGGYARKTADEIENSFAGMARRWLSQLEAIAISIGEAFSTFIEPYKDAITIVLGAIKAFIDSHKKLFGAIAGGTAIVLALGVVFIGLGIALKTVAFTMGGVLSVFKIMTGTLSIFSATCKAVTITFSALSAVIALISAPAALFHKAMVAIGKSTLLVKTASFAVSAGVVAVKTVLLTAIGACYTFIGGLRALQGAFVATRAVAAGVVTAMQLLKTAFVATRAAVVGFAASGAMLQGAFAATRAVIVGIVTAVQLLRSAVYASAGAMLAGKSAAVGFAVAVETFKGVLVAMKVTFAGVTITMKALTASSLAASVAMRIVSAVVSANIAVITAFRNAAMLTSAAMKLLTKIPLVLKTSLVALKMAFVATRAAVVGFAASGAMLRVIMRVAAASVAVFKSVLTGLKAIVGAVKTAIISLQGAIKLLKTAMAAAGNIKLIAIIGAVAGAVAGIWYACKNVNSAWSDMMSYGSHLGGIFKQSFGEIKKTAMEAGPIIYQSLMSGDYIGAFKVTWAAIKYIWQEGITGLVVFWEDFKLFFLDSWAVLKNTLSNVALEIWYGILIGLKAVGNSIANAWSSLWTGIINAFDATMTFLHKRWVELKGLFSGKDVAKQKLIIEEQYQNRVSQRAAENANKKKQRAADLQRIKDERRVARQQGDVELQEDLKQNKASRDANLRGHYARVNAAKTEYEDAKKFAAQFPQMQKVLKALGEVQANAASEYQKRNFDDFQRLKQGYDRRFDAISDPRQRDAAINAEIDRLQKRKENQLAVIESAKTKAAEDRVISPEEAKNILQKTMAAGKLESAIEHLNSRLRSSALANPADAMQKVSSTGAWSFAELYGKIGGASAQERTAKATEQALPWLKKINDNTQRKSGSFVVSYE